LAFTYDPVGNLTQLRNNAQFPGSNLGNAIAAGPSTKTFAYDNDFGGGAGSPFKHIFLGFLGPQHILKKKAWVAPGRQYYPPRLDCDGDQR